MGAWTWHEMYRPNKAPIIIINAYMPCTNSTPGPLTYQIQLVHQLPKIQNPGQVQARFWTDLTEFIHDLQNTGHGIILAMDANANINELSSPVSVLGHQCDLVDVINVDNPSLSQYLTYARGSAHIDTILVSQDLQTSISYTQILPLLHITPSDHHGIILDIHGSEIFGSIPQDITKPSTRKLLLTCSDIITKYVSTLSKSLQQHQVREKLTSLET